MGPFDRGFQGVDCRFSLGEVVAGLPQPLTAALLGMVLGQDHDPAHVPGLARRDPLHQLAEDRHVLQPQLGGITVVVLIPELRQRRYRGADGSAPVFPVFLVHRAAQDPGGPGHVPDDLRPGPQTLAERSHRPAPDADVLEAVALAFSRRTQRAVHRGLLRGYRQEEDALNTVRSQIRFADQIRRRYGLPLPIEVAYDEYTEDIEHSRLLQTAIRRLSHAHIRSLAVRQELRRLRSAFDMVQLGTYPRGAVPEVRYTRLDEYYRPAVELARLIIENFSLELFGGQVSGASFLIDMNVVFERFLYVALGEALGLGEDRWKSEKSLNLDTQGRIKMEPDLSWWPPGLNVGISLPCFVGDAKYKRLDEPGFRHADIYQMLAYCTAADLPSGLLIYAAGEDEPSEYRINHAGKTIEVTALDLSGAPEHILSGVDRLADRVRAHANFPLLRAAA